MKYDLNYGDNNNNNNIIKYLFQPQLGSGLIFTRATSPSKSLICVFLPSDPDELVDQFKTTLF